MGLADIWHELQYFWIDMTTYTQAEQQVDKYRKILAELDKKIPGCEEQLNESKRTGGEIQSYFIADADSAFGEIMDNFTTRQATWNETRTEVLGIMEAALSTAKARREEVSSSLLYWEGEAQLEESQIRSRLWDKKEEKRKEEG